MAKYVRTYVKLATYVEICTSTYMASCLQFFIDCLNDQINDCDNGS